MEYKQMLTNLSLGIWINVFRAIPILFLFLVD